MKHYCLYGEDDFNKTCVVPAINHLYAGKSCDSGDCPLGYLNIIRGSHFPNIGLIETAFNMRVPEYTERILAKLKKENQKVDVLIIPPSSRPFLRDNLIQEIKSKFNPQDTIEAILSKDNNIKAGDKRTSLLEFYKSLNVNSKPNIDKNQKIAFVDDVVSNKMITISCWINKLHLCDCLENIITISYVGPDK